MWLAGQDDDGCTRIEQRMLVDARVLRLAVIGRSGVRAGARCGLGQYEVVLNHLVAKLRARRLSQQLRRIHVTCTRQVTSAYLLYCVLPCSTC